MKYLSDDNLREIIGGQTVPPPLAPPQPTLYADKALIPNGKGGYNLVTITGPSDAFDDAIIAGLGGIEVPRKYRICC